MKKYKVNGKVVVADSLREAIVKYRKFNDAFVLKHFSGKYLSENGDFVFDIDNARRFSTENEAKAKANAMSSEDDTFTVVSVKDAQNYSAGQKFRDPKGRIWEVKSVNGDLLTIAVDGKEMSNKLHKEIFEEWAKTWDAADSVEDDIRVWNDEKITPHTIGRIVSEIKKSKGRNAAEAWLKTKFKNYEIDENMFDEGWYRLTHDSADSIKDFLEPKIGQKYRGKINGGIIQVTDIYTVLGIKYVETIDLKTGYKSCTNYPTFIRLLFEPINDSADSVKDSVTCVWKVWGSNWSGEQHRLKTSFNPSVSLTFNRNDNGRGIVKFEVDNSDKTGSNEYCIVRITANDIPTCEKELNGQISDGYFENARIGKVERIK